ncbi:MAG: hypothetical protein A4E57_01217 [Syntrophorhabdaceae bacterium PtaU1.Bin034]|nr:MAG: hypothetical protein A4E57_01217 [Syntrophorhabdaceae bacterium PtaU1.Bin034]
MQLTRSTDQCKPSRPVSVMEYHGYEDPLIPYDGGASFPVPGGPSITVPSAPESLRRWAQIMGCTGNPVDTSPPDGSGVVQTYETCNAGTQVGLGSIHGGHGLYAQLAIEEYTWAFLTRFTLPLTPAELDRCPGDPSNKGSDDPSGAGAADAASGDSGGGGSGGSCFIATATYGSLHPHVAVLREFRDKHLLTNPPGRAFVRLYHRYSPGIVAIMERHDVFRTASRGMLTPVVYAIKYPCGPLVAVFLAGGVVLAMWRRRRNRGRNRVPGQRE